MEHGQSVNKAALVGTSRPTRSESAGGLMSRGSVPEISVVMPMYNKVGEIARALNSVIAQTVSDFEIIVVDDGSTDGSTEVVQEYADQRITLIRQSNAGESAARNA